MIRQICHHQDQVKLTCLNQRIRSTTFASFSVLGLSIIVGIGLLTILTSYTLVPTISYLERRNRFKTYPVMEWCMNETFQLQRVAHEESGSGLWSNTADAIPITVYSDQELAVLDIRDTLHPRLARTDSGLHVLEKVCTEDVEEKKGGHVVVREL